MPDRYRYIGEGRKTFMSIQRPDLSTLEVDPNDVFVLNRDPKHPEIVKVDRPAPAPKGTQVTAAKSRPKNPE
jgi:hypothetical protein